VKPKPELGHSQRFSVVKAVSDYTRWRPGQWSWLGLALTGWGGLVLLSHRATPGAILWTNRLFGWVVLLSYLSLWASWLVPHWSERRPWFGCVTVNLTVTIVWLALELPAALNLLNWGVLLDRLIAPYTPNHQYRTAFVLDQELAYRRPSHIHWSGLAATDMEAEWLVRPSVLRFLTFNYDARGYRNSTEMDRAEVALLGDSFVDGWYVTEKETTASLLQAELAKPVANLGVAGYGTMQELIVLKREAPRLRPSVVVWFFFEGNDFYDDWVCEKTLKSFASVKTNSHGPGQPVAQAHSWRHVPDKFRVYQPLVELPPGSPCRQWVTWPLPGNFAEFCRASQIPFIDLTVPLQQSVRQGGMPYPPTDSHWSPEGHKLVAKVLHDKLNH
jgi:hypothetical protein